MNLPVKLNHIMILTGEPSGDLHAGHLVREIRQINNHVYFSGIGGPHLEDQKVTKYWFRQAPELKQYLYISSIADELTLVDQQTYVSPDNDIPSLNKRLKENGLGLTITEVLSLTSALCEQPEFCQQATTVKAQFLDTSTNLLWQVTYQIEDQVEPLVFQVDSLTKEVVYQSQK